jgi:hypothetical protein
MQKTIKVFGILVLAVVIGFSFIACGDGDDDGGGGGNSGKLTINGLDDYIGKYVHAQVGIGEGRELDWLFAAKSINAKGEIICEKINGNSITLNVWIQKYGTTNFEGYNGSDNFELGVFISEIDKISGDVLESGTLTVTFNNGIASGTVEELWDWGSERR